MLSVQEIGDVEGVSRQAIDIIEKRALRKFRRNWRKLTGKGEDPF